MSKVRTWSLDQLSIFGLSCRCGAATADTDVHVGLQRGFRFGFLSVISLCMLAVPAVGLGLAQTLAGFEAR